MFKIDKDVELRETYEDCPVHENGRKVNEYRYGKASRGKPVYPFLEMDVGDSIFFEDEPRGSRSNPAVSSRIHGARHGKKFSSRKEGNGVRVWRIE